MKCTVVVGGIENINWKNKVTDTFFEGSIYELPKNVSIKDLQKSVNSDTNDEVKVVLSEDLLNHSEIFEQLQGDDQVLLVYAPPEYVLAWEAEQNGELTNSQIERSVNKWITDAKAIWKMYLSDPDKVLVCGLDSFDLASEKVWQEVLGIAPVKPSSNKNIGDSLTKVNQHFQFLSTQLLRLKYAETARTSSEVNNVLEDLDTVSLMVSTFETDSIAKNQISDVSDVCLISLNELIGCVDNLQKSYSISEQSKCDLEDLKEKQTQEIEKLEIDLTEALDANCALQIEFGKQKVDFDKLDNQNQSKLKQEVEELQAEAQLLKLQVGQLEEELESVDVIASSVPQMRAENESLISTNKHLKQEISKLEQANAAEKSDNQELELLILQVNQLHEELEETYVKYKEITDKAEYRLSKISGLEDQLTKVNTDYESLRDECSSHKLRIQDLQEKLAASITKIDDLNAQCKSHRVKTEELQSNLNFFNKFENNHELLSEIQLLQERLESVYLTKNVMPIALSQGKNYKSSSV